MNTSILIYIALVASGIAIAVSIVALVSSGRSRAWRKVFGQSTDPKTLDEAMEIITNKLQTLETARKDITQTLEEVANQLNLATQFVGLTRYNSSGDDGGNLSFSLALLDAHQSGVVLTSLHGRQNNRIYTKQITKGASEQILSEEEKEALISAVTNSN